MSSLYSLMKNKITIYDIAYISVSIHRFHTWNKFLMKRNTGVFQLQLNCGMEWKIKSNRTNEIKFIYFFSQTGSGSILARTQWNKGDQKHLSIMEYLIGNLDRLSWRMLTIELRSGGQLMPSFNFPHIYFPYFLAGSSAISSICLSTLNAMEYASSAITGNSVSWSTRDVSHEQKPGRCTQGHRTAFTQSQFAHDKRNKNFSTCYCTRHAKQKTHTQKRRKQRTFCQMSANVILATIYENVEHCTICGAADRDVAARKSAFWTLVQVSHNNIEMETRVDEFQPNKKWN